MWRGILQTAEFFLEKLLSESIEELRVYRFQRLVLLGVDHSQILV